MAWALVLCVSALGGTAPQALAGTQYYCTNVERAGWQDCVGARHSLTSNRIWNVDNTNQVGAAALNTAYQYYGNYIYGPGYACHPYSGNNVLHPLGLNAVSSRQWLTGWMYYGVDRWC
jgi:hypothetical protein